MATKKIKNDIIVAEPSTISITPIVDELKEIIDLLKEDLEVTRSELGKTKLDVFKLYDHLVRLKFITGGCVISIVIMLLMLLSRG